MSSSWVAVHTTGPRLPPSASRPHVTTPRLLLRPLRPSDLHGLHRLRAQPDVMRWSAAGRVDADTHETARVLARFLPPAADDDTRASFNCAVCWRETGDFIGIGGMHKRNRVGVDDDDDADDDSRDDAGFGWPEIGYMFVQEYWGMGLGTEFLRAFVRMWESLEREPVEMRVSSKSLAGDSFVGRVAKEQLHAVIDATNAPSQRVLQKCRFDKFAEFDEKSHHPQQDVLTLHAYRWFPSVSPVTQTI